MPRSAPQVLAALLVNALIECLIGMCASEPSFDLSIAYLACGLAIGVQEPNAKQLKQMRILADLTKKRVPEGTIGFHEANQWLNETFAEWMQA